jgi:hypothetical protein
MIRMDEALVAQPADGQGEGRSGFGSHDLSTICWSLAAAILLFFVCVQAGVVLSFTLHLGISPFLAPAALALSLLLADWLARREGLRGRQRIAVLAAAGVITALSLLLAAAFFDMSWDGLWYHQTAVYQMAHGWNPIHDPMHGFVVHVQDALRHYSKGPWYVALALFQTTGDIEWSKPAPLMMMAVTFLCVLAAAVDCGLRRRVAATLAALVALNPVVVCESASYLVDGLMISFLACFVAAQFSILRRAGERRVSPLLLAISVTSAMLCITTKLTGLVYFCLFAAAGGLYVLLRRRDLLVRYTLAQVAAVAMGAAVLGFNPYVTNTLNRGHPFYPWMGTAAHPGYSDNGPNRDPVENVETPPNMVGRSRFVRLGYGIFGRPGSQPFLDGPNAKLMWPFQIGWKDFHLFNFHDVRIGGFGPLFSGALLIAVALLTATLIHPGRLTRVVPILLLCTIVGSLLLSKHTWWARYGPQLWWLPLAAVMAGLAPATWRAVRWTSWILAAILLINGALIAVAHFQWEVEATRTTCQQFAMLRQKSDIQVNLAYFTEPYSERLRAAGVKFQPVDRLPRGTETMELMSVVPGNPGAVRAIVR